ncbi:MAG TPA: hypothetical protein DDW52_28060 [Planctomycetaceae bacterium]|nr:hypothetical protein [Planctomycetaceae bacterium]
MSDDAPTLINLETNEEIRATAVPQRMQQQQTSSWSHSARGAGARSDFTGTSPGRFAIEMLFVPEDTSESIDVRPRVEQIAKLCRKGSSGVPPTCLFSWGSVSSPVVVDDVLVEYSHFSGGVPTYAHVGVFLTEMHDKQQLKTVASQPAALARALTGNVTQVIANASSTYQQVKQDADKKTARLQRAAKATKEAIEDVKRNTEECIAEVRRDAEALQNEVKQEVEKAEQEFKKAKSIVEGGIKLLTELPGELETCLSNKWNSAKTGIESGHERLKKSFNSQKDSITKIPIKLKEILSELETSSSNAVKNLESLKEEALTVTKNPEDPSAIQSFEKRLKESRDAFEELQKNCGNAKTDFAERQLELEEALHIVQQMPNDFATLVDKQILVFAKGCDDCKGKAIDELEAVIEALKEEGEQLKTVLENGIEAIKQSMKTHYDSIKTQLLSRGWDRKKINYWENETDGFRPKGFDEFFKEVRRASEKLKSEAKTIESSTWEYINSISLTDAKPFGSFKLAEGFTESLPPNPFEKLDDFRLENQYGELKSRLETLLADIKSVL